MGLEMKNLTIRLPDDRIAKLPEMAAGLGTSLEELARASLEDLLGRPDEDFKGRHIIFSTKMPNSITVLPEALS